MPPRQADSGRRRCFARHALGCSAAHACRHRTRRDRRVGTAALRVCGAGRWLSLRSTRPRRRRSRASSLTQPRRHWSRASLSPPRRHQCRARSLASPRRLWSRARHPTPPRRLRSRARRATWPRRHQRHASSLRTPRLAVADADRAARPGLASSGAECGPARAPQPRRSRPARHSRRATRRTHPQYAPAPGPRLCGATAQQREPKGLPLCN